MDNSPDFAPPVPIPATTAPQPKRKPIPRRVHDAIELLSAGNTITAASKRVGYARETLSRWLQRPEVIEAVKTRAARAVALGAGRASARLLELLESNSQKVALDAAKHTLAVAGIRPPADASVSVNIELKAGYVIDLTGRKPRTEQIAAKVIDGEAGTVIDAKPVE
jgi:hypothetical protein